jgi:hypothetical protein
MPFQPSVPLTLGGSVNPTIIASPGAPPANIVEQGVPFTVNVGFQITGAGALVLGGDFKITVSFEGLGAAATEFDTVPVVVPVASGAVVIAPPSRTYSVPVPIPALALTAGTYQLVATITHSVGAIIGPIAGISDPQIMSVIPNSPVTIP